MQFVLRMRRVVAKTTNDPWGEPRPCRSTSAVAASADPNPRRLVAVPVPVRCDLRSRHDPARRPSRCTRPSPGCRRPLAPERLLEVVRGLACDAETWRALARHDREQRWYVRLAANPATTTRGSSVGTCTKASTCTITADRRARSVSSRASCSRRRVDSARRAGSGKATHDRHRAGVRPWARPLGRQPDPAGGNEYPRVLSALDDHGLLRDRIGLDVPSVAHRGCRPASGGEARLMTTVDELLEAAGAARPRHARGCRRKRSSTARCWWTPVPSNSASARARSRGRCSSSGTCWSGGSILPREARIPQATDHDVVVILVCSEGYSSSLAAASLQDLGLRNATDLIGGFQAWRDAGSPRH